MQTGQLSESEMCLSDHEMNRGLGNCLGSVDPKDPLAVERHRMTPRPVQHGGGVELFSAAQVDLNAF
jgi:hypothetical protein